MDVGISKFRTARSRLYRSQIWQVNTRWKALDDIYTIYMLLHREDLNISAKHLQHFCFFCAEHVATFCINRSNSSFFAPFFRNFAEYLRFLNNFFKIFRIRYKISKVFRNSAEMVGWYAGFDPPFPHGSAGAISTAQALRGAGHLLEARGLPLLHLRVGGPRDLARGPTVSRDWEKLAN